MDKKFTGKLILEDGSEYMGYLFGSMKPTKAELVFNTSMVGYQEILSDPSYTYQAVCMTYPLIGNYGINDEDYESTGPKLSAMIVREFNDHPSNFRSTKTIDQVFKDADICGLSGIDTRKLTRHIRNYGSCKALITDASVSLEDGLGELKAWEIPHDAISLVSTKNVRVSKASVSKHHIVAIDCGMKENIVRCLNAKGCDVTIVPWDTSAEEIISLNPEGIFISNGPGDPTDAVPTIETVRTLIGRYPIFGICLGHQIISLAYGAKTYKLKFGHRGGNHPVKNMTSGKVEVTSQNHSYAVDAKTLTGLPLFVTHVNLLDKTVEGVKCLRDNVFSVQYHPESAPGPEDSGYLFDEFIKMIEGGNANA